MIIPVGCWWRMIPSKGVAYQIYEGNHPLPLGEGRVRVSRFDEIRTLTSRVARAIAALSQKGRGTLKEVSNVVHSSRQWRPVFGGRGTGDPVVVGTPRFDRSHGHKVRLRYRPVRRLHSADRWRCSEILFYAGRPGRGQKDHYHRRAVIRWVTPGAARMEGV